MSIECKIPHACEKSCSWNPSKYNCGKGKNLASIMDYSKIRCGEIIDV